MYSLESRVPMIPKLKGIVKLPKGSNGQPYKIIFTTGIFYEVRSL